MLWSASLAACSIYDPKLLAGHGDRDAGGGGIESDSGARDAGSDDGAVGDASGDAGPDDCAHRSTCKLDNSVAVCVGTECLIAACDDGFVDCNGIASDGCEATLDSPDHCGVCQHACTFANGASRCSKGTCELAECEVGFGDCDERRDNGCERALTTLSDCGSCGAKCSAENAVTSCDDRQCKFIHCLPGYGDCNEDASKLDKGSGCETKLDTPDHCGACGIICTGATPYCSGGRCTAIDCPPDKADCDNDNMVCETDLTALATCGACGVSCGPLANATVSCASGQCAATCQKGFASCDGASANGCETDIRTTTNCGQCGKPCTYANATTSCATGTCTLSACTAGYGDCNANLNSDGCEQRLNTLQHCGRCNTACALANAASSCNGGSCQVGTCNAGFGNCDGRADNGCEANLNTTNSSCGACGTTCASNRTCSGGRCICTTNSNCGTGQACCNGSCVDVNNDEANCGACGSVCASGQTCCSGSCKNLATDFNNCGSCGNRCDSNDDNRCASGTCKCANDDSCPLFFRCCTRGCEFGLGC